MRETVRPTAILAAGALASALMLAACSNGGADADGDGRITAQEARAEMESGPEVKMRPGEWENSIQFTELDLQGMPEEMQGMVKGMLGQKITDTTCRTDEESAQLDEEFFKNTQNGECTTQEFDRSGNSLKVRMTCTPPTGGEAKVAVDGTFGEEEFRMTMTSDADGGELGAISMKGEITGRRIGDCEA